ncbi:MAG: hypothetical protein IJX86_00590 [Lachnospiraceae bacterium]|nr:hypothetical protein [Lachnospiraceae bacterium]
MMVYSRYSRVSKKTYDELKDYFEIILEFDSNDDYQCVLYKIKKLSIEQKRVWFLVGSNDQLNWECLQVAQTKENILTEISEDVNFMLSYDYSKMVSRIPADRRIKKSSTFYENIYEIDLDSASNIDERRKYSYSKMKEEYVHFRIVLLKVDEYLGLSNFENENENVLNMIEIAKPLYAEAMLAYDMLAKYWNMYNSGVDGQAIMCFLEKQRNYIIENP